MVATRRQQKQQAKSSGSGAAKQNDGTAAADTADDKDDMKAKVTTSEKRKGGEGGSEGSMVARLNGRLDDFLFKQIDISPLVYFRIIFGAIMLWEVTRYLGSNKIERYYIDPTFYFKYFGFSWMPGPLEGHKMYLFYFGMGVLYIFLILGLWYRVTSVLCFLGFFYWFNLDMSQHLNHFYLVSLISFLMMFMPANRNASLDVIRKPQLRVATVPAWTLWMIALQIGIAYFFGGIAKINSDWLQGEPMRGWLLKKTAFPVIGQYFNTWWAPYFFAWNGLFFDLAVVPMLLWKRTRVVAVASTTFFHIMNDNLFSIGIFPWFMLFSTPLYFEPELLRPVLQVEWIFAKPPTPATDKALVEGPRRRRLAKWFFCTFMTWQCLMPFRHLLYPGNTGWSEEGHLYSWHMKLRSKDAYADFTVTNVETGETVDVDQDDFLSIRQQNRMPKRPMALLRFAHHLCDVYSEDVGGPVEVHVENKVTMNGRRRQNLVDPTVDLCKAEMTMRPTPWILPLKIPLWDQSMESLLKRIHMRDGNDFVGIRIAKQFAEDGVFFGTVTRYAFNKTLDEDTWHIVFDDDDEMDFDADELAMSQRTYAWNKGDDRRVNGGKKQKANVEAPAESSEL